MFPLLWDTSLTTRFCESLYSKFGFHTICSGINWERPQRSPDCLHVHTQDLQSILLFPRNEFQVHAVSALQVLIYLAKNPSSYYIFPPSLLSSVKKKQKVIIFRRMAHLYKFLIRCNKKLIFIRCNKKLRAFSSNNDSKDCDI